MPYFKDSDNRLHYLSDEDVSLGGIDLLPTSCVQITDDEADQLLPRPSANDLIKEQIAELEKQHTDRRIREAVLGLDNGWLASLNAQIAALRARLT